MTIVERLEEAGFATAPVLKQHQIDRLLEYYLGLRLPDGHGFYASANTADRSVARSAQAAILSVAAPPMRSLFPTRRPFMASILSKGALTGAQVSMHQDLTYTDERVARSYIAWIPLLPMASTLDVVPGSHHWTNGCRPAGLPSLPTEPLQDPLRSMSSAVEVPAGHAVIYDAALIHGSPANRVDQPRPAVGLAMAPVGVPLIHCHAALDHQVHAYEVEPAFYLDQGPMCEPRGYRQVAPWAEPVTESGLRAHIRRLAS